MARRPDYGPIGSGGGGMCARGAARLEQPYSRRPGRGDIRRPREALPSVGEGTCADAARRTVSGSDES